MNDQKHWGKMGRPWELEILAFAFMAIAVGMPHLIFTGFYGEVAQDTNLVMQTIREQSYILWSISIVVLFIMQVALAAIGSVTISTPAVHLIAPLFFSWLAYYRIYTVGREMNVATFVTGNVDQIILLTLGVMAITATTARLRMARYMMRTRNMQWEIISKARYDASYLQLITQLRPLIYPVRRYRVAEEGILIEGWFFVMPVPFDALLTVTPIRGMQIASAGLYFASNANTLVRFEYLNSSRALFISPEDRDAVVRFSTQRLARIRPSSIHRGRRHGTNPGITGRSTHAGIAPFDNSG